MIARSQISTRANFKSKAPWALLFTCLMTIVFSCSILYWIVTKAPISEKLQIVQLITFTILSSLIIFDRTKGAWTISTMGWVTCLGLLGLSWNSLGAAFAEMSYAPYVLGLMLVANLALTLYYFRHPYIDARTGVLGTNFRHNIAMETELLANGQQWKTSTVSVSPSGFKFLKPADFQGNIGDPLTLKIPEISSFESAAVIVDITADHFAVELRGWTLASTKQHLKLRNWLRKNAK